MTEPGAAAEPAGPEPSLLRRIGRGGSLNLVGAGVQQASLFLTTAVVARGLGRADLGRYVIVYAALTIASLLAQLGLRTALTRFVAGHLAAGEPERIRGLVGFAGRVAGAASLTLGVALVVASGPLSRVFGDADLATGFVVAGVTLPAFTCRDLALATLQGWRTQRAFALIGWIYEPLTRLGLTLGAVVAGLGLVGAYAALTVAAWTAALAGVVGVRRRLRGLPDPARSVNGSVDRSVDGRAVLGFSAGTWGTTLAATGLIWVDTLLLGALADPGEVGVYTVATRLVGLAVFVLPPLDALFAPHFAHLYAAGERGGLATAYTSAVAWSLRLALPAFVVLLVFPRELLALFGQGYVVGASVTLVLVVGQLVNAATGPTGTVLNMCGRVRVNLLDNASVLVLNVVLNLVLIPGLGMLGAALAWSISLVLLNLTKLSQVALLERMQPFDLSTAKALAAAGGGLVVAVVLQVGWGGSLGALVVSGVAVYLAYLTLTVALGLSRDERETLRGVLTRS